jgi:hypothetical protein
MFQKSPLDYYKANNTKFFLAEIKVEARPTVFVDGHTDAQQVAQSLRPFGSVLYPLCLGHKAQWVLPR